MNYENSYRGVINITGLIIASVSDIFPVSDIARMGAVVRNIGSVDNNRRKTSRLERISRGSLFEVLLASVVEEFMDMSESKRFKTLRDEDFRHLSATLSQVVRDAKKHGYSTLTFAADTLLASIEEAESSQDHSQKRFLMKQALDAFIVEGQHTLTEMEERGQNAPTAPDKRAVIMVIDDDAWEYNLILRTMGDDHEVIYANSSNAAMKLLFETRPNLIILDVKMPGMEGTELLCGLKEIPALASIPILMRSNFTEDEDVVRSLVNGALDYLSKEIDPAQLRERILDSLHFGRSRLSKKAG